ncbi:hypothetical protein [Candidatus Protofrankia californiensis]|nr:hypothetical protein [Candidatus Protofrankia californiensis]
MILLPLLILFVGIFVIGLVHDWRYDEPPGTGDPGRTRPDSTTTT